MENSTQQLDARISSLSIDAYKAFCEDINGMFGIETRCTKVACGQGTLEKIRQDFKKIVSCNFVEARGLLEGNFSLMFDQAGTFIIAGIFVMLPEKRILEYIKSGTLSNADFINDAIREVGNMLVGSWDRVFREELAGHKHFRQNGTIIGDMEDVQEDERAFSGDQECYYSVCDITIDKYPTFKCASLIPVSIVNAESADTEPGENENTQADDKPQAENPAENTESAETSEEQSADSDESTAESAAAESADTTDPSGETPQTDVEESPAQTGPVTQAIKEMVTPNAPPRQLTITAAGQLASVTARQVMNPGVLWAEQEDTVEYVMKQMQHHNCGYVIIGKDGQIEGIVSHSDITAAISPYTRSVFSHWRRPLDDASLQIRIKWFMSRPVHTVGPETTLESVILSMLRHSIRALPVVDENGTLMGIVTVFDIFQALTGDTALRGKPQQAPPVL